MAAATIARLDTARAGPARPRTALLLGLRAPVPPARAAGDRGGAARRRHRARGRRRPRLSRPDGASALGLAVQTVRAERRRAGAVCRRRSCSSAASRARPGWCAPAPAGPARAGRAGRRAAPRPVTIKVAAGFGDRIVRLDPGDAAAAAASGARQLLRRVRGVLWQIGLASVVINLLALATPLFMMTVYNKVINHAALQTLDVLAIGMVTLVALRARCCARCAATSRPTPAPGSRPRSAATCVHHLLHLPYRFFEATPGAVGAGARCARSTSCASS